VSTSKMPKYFADHVSFNIMLMYLQELLRNPTAKAFRERTCKCWVGPRNVFSTEVETGLLIFCTVGCQI
jgi:hypothetical protein